MEVRAKCTPIQCAHTDNPSTNTSYLDKWAEKIADHLSRYRYILPHQARKLGINPHLRRILNSGHGTRLVGPKEYRIKYEEVVQYFQAMEEKGMGELARKEMQALARQRGDAVYIQNIAPRYKKYRTYHRLRRLELIPHWNKPEVLGLIYSDRPMQADTLSARRMYSRMSRDTAASLHIPQSLRKYFNSTHIHKGQKVRLLPSEINDYLKERGVERGRKELLAFYWQYEICESNIIGLFSACIIGDSDRKAMRFDILELFRQRLPQASRVTFIQDDRLEFNLEGMRYVINPNEQVEVLANLLGISSRSHKGARQYERNYLKLYDASQPINPESSEIAVLKFYSIHNGELITEIEEPSEQKRLAGY